MINFISEHFLVSLLTIATILSFVWLLVQKRTVFQWWQALLLALCHTVFGVGCVKIFAVMETLDFSNVGNMSLFGGLFFMPVFYWLLSKLMKKTFGEIADVMALSMIVTLLCARINCIHAGCCYGWFISGLEGVRWPTRELEILFYLILLAVLIPRILKRESPGTIYPLYMAAYGAFRFLVEFFRASESLSVFHIAHLWAGIAFALGLSIYFEMKKKLERRKKHA